MATAVATSKPPADLADTHRLTMASDRYQALLKLRALRLEAERIEAEMSRLEALLLTPDTPRS